MAGRGSGLTVDPSGLLLLTKTLRKNALQERQEKPSLCLIQEVSSPHTGHTWGNLHSPAGPEIVETITLVLFIWRPSQVGTGLNKKGNYFLKS